MLHRATPDGPWSPPAHAFATSQTETIELRADGAAPLCLSWHRPSVAFVRQHYEPLRCMVIGCTLGIPVNIHLIETTCHEQFADFDR